MYVVIADRSVARIRCLVAVLGNGVVGLVDGVEHAGHLGDAEPVDPDVADVRLVVQPDVGGVAADRAGPQVLRRSEPFLQPLAHCRGLVEFPAGAGEPTDHAGLGQAAVGLDAAGDQVGDPPPGILVAFRGDREQFAGLVKLALGIFLRAEPAAAQRGAPGAVRVGRQFQLVVPPAVTTAPGAVRAAQPPGISGRAACPTGHGSRTAYMSRPRPSGHRLSSSLSSARLGTGRPSTASRPAVGTR
jgi:hypothetical protein